MREMEIGGRNYRIGDLDARKQFHVARKLGPIVSALVEVMGRAARMAPPEPPPAAAGEDAASLPRRWLSASSDPIGALQPLIEALSTLPDESVDFILDTTLSAVSRQQPSGWAPVMSGGVLMFADLGLAEMVQLAFAVIEDPLSRFFHALPSASAPSRGATESHGSASPMAKTG